MKRDSLTRDADELLMLGEAVAAMLAENQDRLKGQRDVRQAGLLSIDSRISRHAGEKGTHRIAAGQS